MGLCLEGETGELPQSPPPAATAPSKREPKERGVFACLPLWGRWRGVAVTERALRSRSYEETPSQSASG